VGGDLGGRGGHDKAFAEDLMFDDQIAIAHPDAGSGTSVGLFQAIQRVNVDGTARTAQARARVVPGRGEPGSGIASSRTRRLVVAPR
jgi:hypothetical protein